MMSLKLTLPGHRVFGHSRMESVHGMSLKFTLPGPRVFGIGMYSLLVLKYVALQCCFCVVLEQQMLSSDIFGQNTLEGQH